MISLRGTTKFLSLFLWLTSLSSIYAFAQVTNASISGLVRDQSGAVVANAEVKATNLKTGIYALVKTNNHGSYSVQGLVPGEYTLRIQKQGFKVTELKEITLTVGQEFMQDVRLDIGNATDSVTVTADGLQMNTTDGSVSTVIDRNFVANIPLNGRSFQDLISLTPGVVTQSPQSSASSYIGNNGDFAVNGQRTESNNYIIDGLSANTNAGGGGGNADASGSGSIGASTALGTTQSLLSVDALEEFRVESSTYSAEYGTSPGAQFSFVTRSGSSSFHGTLFDYLRNNYFDANDWFNDYYGIRAPALRQNDFGGTLGGYVPFEGFHKTSESFFFFSYEGLRLAQPEEASLQYVPSKALRTSAPTVLQPVLNAFPLPTGPEVEAACDNVTFPCPSGQALGTPVPSGLAPFVAAFSLPSQIDATSLRLDHSIGPHVHTFVRVAYTPSSSTSRSLSMSGPFASNLLTFSGGADFQISSSIANAFRLGYSRGESKLVQSVDSFGGATPTNLQQAFGAGLDSRSGPGIALDFNGVGNSAITAQNTANYNYQWNSNDALSWSIGRHLIKAGISYRRITAPLAPTDIAPVYGYYEPLSVTSNSADSLFVANMLGISPVYNQFSAFGQDEWRATQTLSLSLGVRWEVEPPPASNNGVKIYPLRGDPNDPKTWSLGAPGASLYSTTWNNLAPRLGVAWKLRNTPENQTVLRGGAGVFYDAGLSGTGSISASTGTSAYESFSAVAFPLTPAEVGFSPAVISPPYEPFVISPAFRLPYTVEWNVALEQAITKDQDLTITYLGANGRRLMEETITNAASVNPDFSYTKLFHNGLTSNYQALQVQFQRHISRGLQALVSYTWSHAIDFGSSNISYGYKRGNSDIDLRNAFNAALSWDLPYRGGGVITKAVLSNWGVDGRFAARTAFPVNIVGSTYYDPISDQLTTTEVNAVPGAPYYIYSNGFPGGRAINSNAFAEEPTKSQGNAPRNGVRGFGEDQLNLAVRRQFVIAEGVRLQFRAEAFNLFNHPNFGFVDPHLSDVTFGQATQTLAQSLVTVNSIYQQGGARSMQFALKLSF